MWKKLETKRYIVAGLLLTLASVACTGKRNGVTGQNNEPDIHGPLLSNVAMNDPNAGAQLLSGFYGVENNAWRWTAGTFSVLLKTPSGAGQRGATLTVAFSLPDVEIQKLKDNGITASINGALVKSEKYETGGSYVFSADVPAALLSADSVKVDFALDRTMRADGDKRDLGIIANSVSISSR
jgi:hypothetical protein